MKIVPALLIQTLTTFFLWTVIHTEGGVILNYTGENNLNIRKGLEPITKSESSVQQKEEFHLFQSTKNVSSSTTIAKISKSSEQLQLESNAFVKEVYNESSSNSVHSSHMTSTTRRVKAARQLFSDTDMIKGEGTDIKPQMGDQFVETINVEEKPNPSTTSIAPGSTFSSSTTEPTTTTQPQLSLPKILGGGGSHNSKNEASSLTLTVYGLRVQEVEKEVTYKKGGISVFLVNVPATILLIGQGFTTNGQARFVPTHGKKGEICSETSDSTDTYTFQDVSPDGMYAIIIPVFPKFTKGRLYYLCTRKTNDGEFYFQSSDGPMLVEPYDHILPFWFKIVSVIKLLLLSGLFAGLTLGIMALDRTDLKILSNTGSEKERRYATTILPLRNAGNYLLCSLVLGNVLVNSTLTILLDDLTSGPIAVLFSTISIVIVGEIIPQAVCSRYGLVIGAKTYWITKLLMWVTFPVSKSISLILDKILGEEIGFVYNREKLKELITVTSDRNDLEADEVNIISGALTMRKKSVDDIMTQLDEVYMLPLDCTLDYNVLAEIRTAGYSRIPIYENERTNIVSVLYTKDLIFVDPDDRTPLKALAALRAYQLFFVLGDTTLDVVFKEFNETKRGHMAFVQRIENSNDERDPYYVTIGVITLEDVIQELIQYNRQVKSPL